MNNTNKKFSEFDLDGISESEGYIKYWACENFIIKIIEEHNLKDIIKLDKMETKMI